ncbi:NIPSNAP family containing protein [Oxalobacteraceae bacterium OM1]|nr:NIPSNAP family containing protein [Oxalobacteraceae bacterium OM1]
MEDAYPIVELRQYINYPGTRDKLIDLFDKHFVESQEAVGMRIFGQFREVNDANRFVWLRGFPDMEARRKALTDFYFGPVWQAYRGAANPTLYDNDNVLLLHPAVAGSGFRVDPTERPGTDSAAPGSFVVATLYYFSAPVSATFVQDFEHLLLPLFERNGARVLGRYVSDHSPNTFERLPVREGENVFAWFAAFADRAAYDAYIAALAREADWRDDLFGRLHKALARPPEVLMLAPTARSLLR